MSIDSAKHDFRRARQCSRTESGLHEAIDKLSKAGEELAKQVQDLEDRINDLDARTGY